MKKEPAKPSTLDYASPDAEDDDDFWGVRSRGRPDEAKWNWSNFGAGMASGTVTQGIAYGITASFYAGKTTNPLRDGIFILLGFLFFDVMLKLLVIAIVSSRLSDRVSFKTGLVTSYVTLFASCVLFARSS